MATTTLSKDFQISELVFGSVQKNKVGGNIVYMNLNGKRTTLQTPWLNAPFGLSTFTDDNGNDKYSIDVSFKTADSDEKVNIFLSKMKELDEKILDKAVESSKEWFGNKKKKEILEELYRPIVKLAKDPSKYAPTMKFKIQNLQQLEIYDTKANVMKSSDIMSGAQVKGIIQCSSVWFVNKTFGVTWNLVQLQMKKPDRISGFSFKPEEEDEDEEETEEVETEEVEAEEDDL